MTIGMEFPSRSETPEMNQDETQEVGEVKPEALETARQVEQATFEPEAVVERGDYQQAEAIEAAFVKAVDEHVVPTETRQQDTASSDIKLDEPKAADSLVPEIGQRDEEGEDSAVNVTEKIPSTRDQPEDIESIPLTLEQVIEKNPVISGHIKEDSPEVGEKKPAEIEPNMATRASGVQNASDRIRTEPAFPDTHTDLSDQFHEVPLPKPTGTASMDLDPEILMKRDLQAETLEAFSEARDAEAEAESLAAALEPAREDVEAAREVYESSLADLQNAIDRLNVLLIAHGYEPVTMTVNSDGITISNNINSSIYGDVYGSGWDVVGEILTLGNNPESWNSSDAWGEANALRIEVLTMLGIANMALARLNQAQANYDDLQGRSSEASQNAEAAEAEAQRANAARQAAENVYQYGAAGASDLAETLVANSEAERLAAERAELIEARDNYEEARAAYDIALVGLQGDLISLNLLLNMAFNETVTMTEGSDQITLSDNYYLPEYFSPTSAIAEAVVGDSVYAQASVIRSQIEIKLGVANLALAKMNQAQEVYEDLQNQYNYIDLAENTDPSEAVD